MSSEYAVQKRRARKTYWCANGFDHDCRINPGDEYWAITDFKGSDAGYAAYAGHPVQMRVCDACYRRRNLSDAQDATARAAKD